MKILDWQNWRIWEWMMVPLMFVLSLIFALCIIRYARWNSNLTTHDCDTNMWDETGD